MKKRSYIKLSDADVRRFLKGLEILVVSFDRLGSTFRDDPVRLAIETDRFLSEANAFKILSTMRKTLWEACDSQKTKAQVNQLEKSLEKVNIWRQKS